LHGSHDACFAASLLRRFGDGERVSRRLRLDLSFSPLCERGDGDGERAVEDAYALEARAERDEIRRDRHRELKRELRMEAMSEEKKAAKSFAARDRERDVSEKIALGQAVQQSKDALFDQRLFNQTQGMDSGFKEEESYDLYDKPLFNQQKANYIYRAKGDGAELLGGDEEEANQRVQKIIEKSTSKFVADKGFKGTEKGGPNASARQKPVEFTKDADPYALDELLSSAKGSSSSSSSSGDSSRKRTLDGIGKQGYMSASAGSAAGSSSSDYKSKGFDPHASRMEFEESSDTFSSSSSSSSSSRRDSGSRGSSGSSRGSDDDRGGKRRRLD